MSANNDYSLDVIKAKVEQIFDPNFFGLYSFEYAYRLLLVYLSTNGTLIKGIRMANPNAFDEVFKDNLLKAIAYIVNYRGLDAGETTLSKLRDTANESLILFIKAAMANPPQKVAKSVAKSMDKIAKSSLEPTARYLLGKIFEENK